MKIPWKHIEIIGDIILALSIVGIGFGVVTMVGTTFDKNDVQIITFAVSLFPYFLVTLVIGAVLRYSGMVFNK
jgi:hypothetical protein